MAIAATLSKGYDLDHMRPQLPIDGFGSPSMGRGERLELEAADVLPPFEQCGAVIATPAGARVRWSRGTGDCGPLAGLPNTAGPFVIPAAQVAQGAP